MVEEKEKVILFMKFWSNQVISGRFIHILKP